MLAIKMTLSNSRTHSVPVDTHVRGAIFGFIAEWRLRKEIWSVRRLSQAWGSTKFLAPNHSAAVEITFMTGGVEDEAGSITVSELGIKRELWDSSVLPTLFLTNALRLYCALQWDTTRRIYFQGLCLNCAEYCLFLFVPAAVELVTRRSSKPTVRIC